MPFSDRELLARLIQCEAGGEGDTGMQAVASVIMNRVYAPDGEYARVGKQNIYNMNPEQIHYDIADWAIAGNRLPPLGEALWFFNPFSPECRERFPSSVGIFVVRIGEHCFYNPTEEYSET